MPRMYLVFLVVWTWVGALPAFAPVRPDLGFSGPGWRQVAAPLPEGDEPYPGAAETPEANNAPAPAIPLVSLILGAGVLVVFVVGVCLRFCLRKRA